MKNYFKISLVIAGAVLMVAVISYAFGPEKRPFKPGLIDSSTEFQKLTNVPMFLQRSFPDTDFSKADPIIEQALSGGPAKDGIPAIDQPKFVSLAEYERSDEVLALVIESDETVKVYPYNILTWHEIVNDTVAGVPIAVTFCPLCGSAIVYDRRLQVGSPTFGVSGALIESNMVMYDRDTESLWQQSTGEVLAGELFGTKLELFPFQLLSMGEVKEKYPNAKVLSEDTGHVRDYARNPYSGYNENSNFIFQLSSFDERFEPKTIMAVFRVEEVVVATPWQNFADGESREILVAEKNITLTKSDGELVVSDESGNSYPFFFEMWFSFAVQNPEGIVVD